MKHSLLGVHVVCKFFLGCSLDVKQTKQMAVDVKHSGHVEHRTVDVIFGFASKHGEREFNAEMSQYTCSDARHQRCQKGQLQVTHQSKPLRFSAWPDSFLLVCVCEG